MLDIYRRLRGDLKVFEPAGWIVVETNYEDEGRSYLDTHSTLTEPVAIEFGGNLVALSLTDANGDYTVSISERQRVVAVIRNEAVK